MIGEGTEQDIEISDDPYDTLPIDVSNVPILITLNKVFIISFFSVSLMHPFQVDQHNVANFNSCIPRNVIHHIIRKRFFLFFLCLQNNIFILF